mmetsp:Transcript_129715/g.225360  ORF Transcript_129715/g.225360 Transcript_129715/m.225360 type:complete len:140 (-) Transcript_129715:88-507(-)
MLMNNFTDAPDTLIADVDCTAAGKSLCQRFEIRGYPTIKYGDPDDLQDYNGGREYDDIFALAKDLKPPKPKTEVEKIILKVQREVKRAVKPLLEDVQHILRLRKNAAVLLVLVGFFMGALTVRCICPRRIVVSEEKKSS